MRVTQSIAEPGTRLIHDPTGVDGPTFGVVYCVEDFYVGPVRNIVMLVGFGGWRRQQGYPHPIGWPAKAFRKVDEIKLCVRAAQNLREPVEANTQGQPHLTD